MHCIQSNIISSMHQGKVSAVILLDLSAALILLIIKYSPLAPRTLVKSIWSRTQWVCILHHVLNQFVEIITLAPNVLSIP